MFKHWKTTVAGILLAAAQSVQMGLDNSDSIVAQAVVAALTAVLGLLAHDGQKVPD